jgi:putative ATP-binding cassette transporter
MRELLQVMSFLFRLSNQIRLSRLKIAFVLVAGIVSGLANTGMIALVTQTLIGQAGTEIKKSLIVAFLALCLALPGFRLVSQILLIGLTQKSLLDLRMRLARRVLDAPLGHLERQGQHKLLATLTNDIGVIVEALLFLPALFMNLAIALSCLAYLGYLSWTILLEVSVFIVIGILSYQLPMIHANKYFTRSRRFFDLMTKHTRALVEGTKELKMHRARRLAFLDSFESATTSLQAETRKGSYIFAIASSWGQVLFFVVIGLLVFVVPRFQSVPKEVLVGYAIVLFQLMGPLELLLGAFPVLSRAAVSVRTIEELGFSLANEAREQELDSAVAPENDWKTLELAGVTHSYRREREDETFQLGPIDLSFVPGELVFLVGGNGSGKTSLAKLLLGLYAPEVGELRLDGQAVTDADRVRYRERFSVVFSDFFVFDTLFGLDASSLDEDAKSYLSRLHLDHKVKVEDGVLSTIELSQGQKKRLALLTAYLEDRPIYLFDEWAADQDPFFKEVFYLQLLPELKRRGKTVFVISHDDRYFHVADRVVKMEDGKLEFDRSMSEFLEMPTGSLFGTAKPAHA